jgi:hypothetical protein
MRPAFCVPVSQDQELPALPVDVVRNILDIVIGRWSSRPGMLAKEEVKQWTSYSLVCKEWQAAFQKLPICVVFDKVCTSFLHSCMYSCLSHREQATCANRVSIPLDVCVWALASFLRLLCDIY